MDVLATREVVAALDNAEKHNRKKLVTGIFVFFSLSLFNISYVFAEDDDDSAFMEAELATTYDLSRDEFETRLKPLDFSLMGDSIDIGSGAISFSVTDVSLPGNSGLEVAFRRIARETQASHNPRESGRRAYQPLADWNLDVPSVSTFRFRTGSEPMGELSFAGCFTTDDVYVDESIHMPQHGTYVSELALSGGVNVNLPGGRTEQILMTSLSASGNRWEPVESDQLLGASNQYTTLHCRGTYSEVTTKNGVKYFITKKVLLPATDIESFARSSTFSFQNFNRYKEVHLATKAQDVHGNTVDWTYDDMGRLTKISSNDGRTIEVNYVGSSRHVSTVEANGRTWEYNYKTTGYSDSGGVFYSDEDKSGQTTVLESVTQPDGKSWVYDLSNLTNARVFSRRSLGARVISVTHPYGAHSEFELEGKLQDISVIDIDDYNRLSVRRNNLSLIRKTITGSQLPSSTWLYTYEEPLVGSDGEADFGDNLKRVTKTSPDSGFTEYFTFIPANGTPTGKVKTEKRFATQDGNLLQQIDQSFAMSEPFGEVGSETYVAGSFDYYLVEKTVEQNEDTYTTTFEFETDPSDSNYSYGQPLVINSSSNLPNSTSRKVINTYENLKSKWLLGLISTTKFNGKLYYEYDYDSFGRLKSVDSFGVDTNDYTYYTSGVQSGLVSTATDGIGRVTKFQDYYRGIPETVIRAYGTADQVSISREVDDNGWINSVTDGKGQKDTVLRDSMGRIKEIDPFGSWYNTTISYDFLSSGGLKQTIQRYNNKLIITYDELLRTILEKSEDTASGWFAYRNFKFDSVGNEIFSSNPSTSSLHSQGLEKEYDELGRVEREVQYPSLTTTYSYSTDNQIVVTDPDGYQTTTQRSGYSSANDGDVVSIKSPESTTTQMTYDSWGNLSTVRQFGNREGYSVDETHKYFYDGRMRLCRHHVDEIGSKLMAYDDADQLVAYSEGQASGTSCFTPSAGKISLSYDNLGQLFLTDFSDSTTPDISRSYDDNGNIKQISRGVTSWSYQYFDNDKLKLEQLSIDGLNFKTSYERDKYGNISKITYPSGDAISQSPDAFGRPTKLTATNTAYNDVYASDVQYHLNQSLKSFSYGNEVQFLQNLNNRLLPETRNVWIGSGTSKISLLGYNYTYDNRGNTLSITNGVNSQRSVTNTYDGLSRLETSSSAFGDITFKYDAVGNLRKRSVIGGDRLGGSQHTATMTINSKNQVSSASTEIGNRVFRYDTRGNITSNGTDNFNYDLANQPTSSGTDSFIYDGNLKRVKKSTDTGVVYFVYTKEAGLISQYSKTNSMHTDYIRLGKQLVARVESSGSLADSVTTPFNDHIDDSTSQDLTERGYYLPFGKNISNENNHDSAIGFTGHVYDKSGLSYMQARYYDPVIGRFYSNDPVDSFEHLSTPNGIHGFNRYAYANNNPYAYIDPTGRTSEPTTQIMMQGKPMTIEGPYTESSVNAKTKTSLTVKAGRLGTSSVVGKLTLKTLKVDLVTGTLRGNPIGLGISLMTPTKMGDATCEGNPGACGTDKSDGNITSQEVDDEAETVGEDKTEEQEDEPENEE